MHFSQNEKLLATTSETKITVWDLDVGTIKFLLQKESYGVSINCISRISYILLDL